MVRISRRFAAIPQLGTKNSDRLRVEGLVDDSLATTADTGMAELEKIVSADYSQNTHAFPGRSKTVVEGDEVRNFERSCLRLLFLTVLLALIPTTSGIAGADDLSPRENRQLGAELWDARPTAFQICPKSEGDPDRFALCATATCRTLDEVAYCKCNILNEKSISLPFAYQQGGESKNVCDLLLAGIDNGFTISTYATPRRLETKYKGELGPPLALYTCPADTDSSKQYSAQCDGGVCFTSTRGREFPGFGTLGNDEIICSCPPVKGMQTGFQIAGPWKCEAGDKNLDGRCCDQAFQDKFCSVDSIQQTGTEIAVGAVTGFPAILSKILDGSFPSVNRCVFRDSDPDEG
jgi:hypothetical protein